jgi:hypothetical protein
MTPEITPEELALTASVMTELELMRALLAVLTGTITAIQTANLNILFDELDRRVKNGAA